MLGRRIALALLGPLGAGLLYWGVHRVAAFRAGSTAAEPIAAWAPPSEESGGKPSDSREGAGVEASPASGRAAQADRCAGISSERGWVLRGRIYDLATLGPVPEAELLFQEADSGRTFRARSARDGSYRARLPGASEAGYAFQVRHPDYGHRHLRGRGVEARSMPARARMELAKDVGRTLLVSGPVTPQELDGRCRLDVYLVSNASTP